jgi:hypothetical protein
MAKAVVQNTSSQTLRAWLLGFIRYFPAAWEGRRRGIL